MKIVVDMNLGKDWVACLEAGGHTAIHWSSIGESDDEDAKIMAWASLHEHVVFTADLDFGTLLASTNANWPSVVQLRVLNTPSSYSGSLVLNAIQQSAFEIDLGALVTVHTDRFRVRPLPIKSTS